MPPLPDFFSLSFFSDGLLHFLWQLFVCHCRSSTATSILTATQVLLESVFCDGLLTVTETDISCSGQRFRFCGRKRPLICTLSHWLVMFAVISTKRKEHNDHSCQSVEHEKISNVLNPFRLINISVCSDSVQVLGLVLLYSSCMASFKEALIQDNFASSYRLASATCRV